MRESTIESALKARIKALGGKTRKLKWIGVNGAPDQLVMLPSGITFVELKRPKETARKRQEQEHKLLRECKQEVLVIDSLELIDHHFPLTEKEL